MTSLIEPPRPSPEEVASELAAAIRTLAGPEAVMRDEQLAAVTAMVADDRRTLLVARTGFGKSAVYFAATAMLRARGWGPTVVVSPLLALMRDQVAAAARLGLSAATINSSNIDAWDDIEQQLVDDQLDLLLIAPERLANPGFRERVFASLLARPIALVCDEAHCISDWGHDFRPDYLRLRRLLEELPAWTPVLATTATANQRVTDDVARQLGEGALVLRTTLDRSSLHISVAQLETEAERWAFIAHTLPRLEGSGIVYTLTVEAAHQLAAYLQSAGVDAHAYTGSSDPEQRAELETALRDNRVTALVATSALGMGFDKPDLAFCVHLGLPPSPVAYYQQIGRAGRGLDRAEVIALPRPEDQRIWQWFESVSLPSEEVCHEVLSLLDVRRPTSLPRLESTINLSRTRLSSLLDILDVQGAIVRTKGGWIRPASQWSYDRELSERLTALRRAEAGQMLDWAQGDGCRLHFLRQSLDDTESTPCGRCDNCTGERLERPDQTLVAAAHTALQGNDLGIEPRRQWPSGLDEPKGRIAAEHQANLGRSLARLGDGGWDPLLAPLLDRDGIHQADEVDQPALEAIMAGLIGVLRRWKWARRPTWICPMPSARHQPLIDQVAARLGQVGSLPIHHALRRIDSERQAQPQAELANSAHQVANVWGQLSVDGAQLPERPIRDGPVLLIDDVTRSRWTLTVATYLLRNADCGEVLPLVLRQA